MHHVLSHHPYTNTVMDAEIQQVSLKIVVASLPLTPCTFVVHVSFLRCRRVCSCLAKSASQRQCGDG